MIDFTYRARFPDVRDFTVPVTDGDTVWLELDYGRRTRADMAIRLDNVHAPDKTDGPSREWARVYVQGWLLAHGHGLKWPWEVKLLQVVERGGQDSHEDKSFDRYVGQLRCAVDRAFLNAEAEHYYRSQEWPWGN